MFWLFPLCNNCFTWVLLCTLEVEVEIKEFVAKCLVAGEMYVQVLSWKEKGKVHAHTHQLSDLL